ncbi:acyl carrier protein [Corynebacterium gallinarum]|uniref:Acyl carrier protein n=1 Tax=Corynebacterium gallinarum TaxID=2762214 RepID=A0A8I0LGR1_9CORY|nr:acyl carrier protein [Corynebacterium gallinarum]MBD8029030.1 acyl carrier protein [Corynebacterium gallinarum]
MIPNSTNTPETPDDARSDMLTTLVGILSDVGGVSADDITTTARLREDLAISSLNLIEAVVRVEDAFGVRIEDADVQGFTTLGDIIDFLETNRSETVS